jgi:hypothetical protein
MSDLVTIETYSDSTAAALAKNDLIASGITAFLAGEETNALWHVPTQVGVIKLQVAAEDAEKAREILSSPATFLPSDLSDEAIGEKPADEVEEGDDEDKD